MKFSQMPEWENNGHLYVIGCIKIQNYNGEEHLNPRDLKCLSNSKQNEIYQAIQSYSAGVCERISKAVLRSGFKDKNETETLIEPTKWFWRKLAFC